MHTARFLHGFHLAHWARKAMHAKATQNVLCVGIISQYFSQSGIFVNFHIYPSFYQATKTILTFFRQKFNFCNQFLGGKCPSRKVLLLCSKILHPKVIFVNYFVFQLKNFPIFYNLLLHTMQNSLPAKFFAPQHAQTVNSPA